MKIGDTVYLCKSEYNILYKVIISNNYYFNSEGGDKKKEHKMK